MRSKEFKQEVIQTTLRAFDKQPDAWITFNDVLHTKILEMEDIMSKKDIELMDDELPILECDLGYSYLLITTERVISILDDSFNTILIEDMQKFSNDTFAESYKITEGKYPKISTFTIIKNDCTEMLFLVDSYYPASFTILLIKNILSYKTLGKWFINPRRIFKSE